MPVTMVDIIGAVAAVTGTLSWLPQAVRTIRTRDTHALSLVSNLLVLATVGLWFAYGVALGALPLIAANGISLVLVSVIVVMKLVHG